jgi:hypothetical protein
MLNDSISGLIKTLEKNTAGRDFVVSNLQRDPSVFTELLAKSGFNPLTDRLIALGGLSELLTTDDYDSFKDEEWFTFIVTKDDYELLSNYYLSELPPLYLSAFVSVDDFSFAITDLKLPDDRFDDTISSYNENQDIAFFQPADSNYEESDKYQDVSLVLSSGDVEGYEFAQKRCLIGKNVFVILEGAFIDFVGTVN